LLARHGESEWNRVRRFQGANDVGLSDVGRAQAEALGCAVKRGYRVAVAYVSPMRRALETAELALAGTTIPRVPLPDLREGAHGGVISLYLCHLLGVSFNALWRLRIDNGSLTIAKPPRLVCVNDTAHLPPSPRSMWFDTSGVGDAPRSETPTSLWAPPTPDGDLAS